MTRPIAVLFDVDETLVHTGGAGGRSWTWAFDQLYGEPADIGEHSSAGETDPEVGRATFRAVIGRDPEPDEMARLYAKYLWHLADTIWDAPGYRVFDGAVALLDRLLDAGVILGVTSGAMEGAARIKLAPARLDRYFVFGAYGSDSPQRDELVRHAVVKASLLHGRDLTRDEVWVVGDTPHDIEAARSAGATAVGVATGHYDVDELRAAHPDYVLQALTEPFPGLDGQR